MNNPLSDEVARALEPLKIEGDTFYMANVALARVDVLQSLLRRVDAEMKVPRVATKEMLQAGWGAVTTVTNGSNHLMALDPVWVAMYDAAITRSEG